MFRRIFGNIKLTNAIAALVISSIIVSVAVSSAAIYVNLTASARGVATTQLTSNLKTAATVVQSELPGARVDWNDDGSLAGIKTWVMPRQILKHTLVDSIVRITGETATLFSWDEETGDFKALTTSIMDANGERDLGQVFTKDDPAYDTVVAGTPYQGEATISGRPSFTTYQPILDSSGAVRGILYVGVDRDRAEAVVYDTLRSIMITGAITLAVLGAVGLVMSRLMMAPVPALARTMKIISDGDFDAEVPYIHRGNEIGDMARAVEVFRENGLKISQMSEEERAASIRRREERTDMMQALQAAFGEVVDAAIAGDFSKRVLAEFSDQELNGLAASVNNLVETVDRGIGETGEVLAALADTDLTRRMEGDYEGSFAKLKSDINAVGNKLTDVVAQLRVTSRALKTATGEILSGTNDLSERTTKQAATIEETSAAMEQLATTVVQNSRMAEDANGKAQAVSDSAGRTGSVMGQATEAMERITSSSAKISNIIGMIDDIAFQTNLLALNASVEAARAGDAGKGFAVVAVEVRRLAQSAASASSEVKVLIEQSANEVKGGSKLVADASAQLTTMLEAINENSMLMQGIARASREQASAIDEVSVAVRTMDEMTQHNAALVEQTNAAIEQTEAQASELDRVVEIFRIEEGAQPERERERERDEPAPVRGVVNKIKSAARSYLSQGNAAISTDWNEF